MIDEIIELLRDMPDNNKEYRMRLIIDTIKMINSPKYINKAKLMVVRFEDKLSTDFDRICITLDDYRYQQKKELKERRRERAMELKLTNELIKVKNEEYDLEHHKSNKHNQTNTVIDKIEKDKMMNVSETIINNYAEKLSMDVNIKEMINYDFKSRCFLKKNKYSYQKVESIHESLVKLHCDHNKLKNQNDELHLKLVNQNAEVISINAKKTYLEALLTTVNEENETKIDKMKSAISELLSDTHEFLENSGEMINTDERQSVLNIQYDKKIARSLLIKKKIDEYLNSDLKLIEEAEFRNKIDSISDYYSNSDYDYDSGNEWENDYDD